MLVRMENYSPAASAGSVSTSRFIFVGVTSGLLVWAITRFLERALR